jgi:ribosomal protein L16 Arg81 hydroxylase|tara:strand:+ start:190 stop:420 length:231 start_codon:yes stop_codon:yes gene_type:complete
MVAHPAHLLEHESGSASADESVQQPARGESDCPIAFASVALEPGDVLFIPRGWWHEVDAEGTAEDGVSCSTSWCFC